MILHKVIRLQNRVISTGNAWKRMEMPFPLLRCLRTPIDYQYLNYRRHCAPFSGQNALDCRVLHIQSRNIFPGGRWYPRNPQKRPMQCLDPDTNFRLAHQRCRWSCSMKRQLLQKLVLGRRRRFVPRGSSFQTLGGVRNNTYAPDDIYSAVIYGASHMREFTVVHLGRSRSAPGGRQLVGQAANLTFESACRLL